jgi:hypothetical protein
MTSTSKVQKKSLESPDETLTFEKEKIELFETFHVGWKIWRETMNYQGIVIKIKVR